MKPVDIVNTLVSFFPWGYTKLAILILLALYIVFSAVIVRQETLMSRVIEIPLFPPLRVIVLIHFITAIAIFVLSLILL